MSTWPSLMQSTSTAPSQYAGPQHPQQQQQQAQQQDEYLYQHHMAHPFQPDPVANFLERSSIYNGYHQDLCHRYAFPDEDPSTSSLSAMITRPTISPFPPSSYDFQPGSQAPCEWSDHTPFFCRPHLPYSPSDKSTPTLTPTMNHIVPSLYMTPTSSDPSSMTSMPKHTAPPLSGPLLAPPSTTISADIRAAPAIAPPSRHAATKAEGVLTSGTRPREKKHGCWMCEKSFDRPSTLRKHLLVHTGEKAFVCDICGRRFGVASNLNRHVKRCILKPVNTAHSVKSSTSPSSATPPSSTSAASSIESSISALSSTSNVSGDPPASSEQSSNKRKNMGDPCSSSPSGPSSPSQSASTKSPSISKAPPKRRRRAPSPSQWIPTSLLPFKILPMEFIKSTSVPLPPVSAYKDETTDEWIEERDSWDESVGVTPYHPCAWKGKLPGPGLGFGGRDLSNLGLVGGSGFVMGRLVML